MYCGVCDGGVVMRWEWICDGVVCNSEYEQNNYNNYGRNCKIPLLVILLCVHVALHQTITLLNSENLLRVLETLTDLYVLMQPI